MNIEEFFKFLNKFNTQIEFMSIEDKEKIYLTYFNNPNYKVIFDKISKMSDINDVFKETFYINYYYIIDSLEGLNFLIYDTLKILYLNLSNSKFFELITQEIYLSFNKKDFKKIENLGYFLFFETEINLTKDLTNLDQIYIFQNALLFSSVLYLKDKTTDINKLYSKIEYSLNEMEKDKFKKILLDRINSFIFIA